MKIFLFFILLLSSLVAKQSEVSLQLQWKHQFQFAGYYIAKEKGFYKDVGLDVTIKEYKPKIDVVGDVISSKSTFGIGRSSLIVDRGQGKPIIILGAAFQKSPLILIATNPKIKTIDDLKNKRVMITQDAVVSATILGMLVSNSISKENVVFQKHSLNLDDLINNKTDAMASYISNETYTLEKKGIKYNVFDPADYEFDFYEDMLFTSEEEIDSNPQTVKDFRDASIKGWLWAFENIEETAKIIHDKYNTQNKTIDALMYEGNALKKLAFVGGVPFFYINKKKIKQIATIFHLKDMIKRNCKLDKCIYDSKQEVKIGVLAKRGRETTIKRWNKFAEYLSKELEYYNFKIVPLSFDAMKNSVKNENIDFVITNTMFYVVLENYYGISRIATLVNADKLSNDGLKKFGGVIFTKSSNTYINKIKDVKYKKVGAVSKLSFGGWVMGYDELLKNNIDLDDIDESYLGTHDGVVDAVLNGDVEVGIVRTDTLERMQSEGKIKLSDIKILGAKKYDDFPYLVSTKLYPEWPIAKLEHTKDHLANQLLSKLVSYEATPDDIKQNNIKGWTVPLDYSSVHTLLRKLRLEPYEDIEVTFKDIVEKYVLHLYIAGIVVFLLILRVFYDHWYSKKLDFAVKKKTRELIKANEKLKILANQDFLTGISNRSHFMKFAKKYFEIARRNDEELQMLSLDLDYFKKINDTYGHQAGDCVLKNFTNKVSSLLRKSDIFGRVGGEEFCIVLQNTSLDGAKMFAKRICESIEDMQMDCDGNLLSITVSIGISSLNGEDSVEELIKKSDIALYEAKDNGRNQVRIYI